MKCPWKPRKETTYFPYTKAEVVTTIFDECYKDECPFYSPEIKISENLSRSEGCNRAILERKKVEAQK